MLGIHCAQGIWYFWSPSLGDLRRRRSKHPGSRRWRWGLSRSSTVSLWRVFRIPRASIVALFYVGRPTGRRTLLPLLNRQRLLWQPLWECSLVFICSTRSGVLLPSRGDPWVCLQVAQVVHQEKRGVWRHGCDCLISGLHPNARPSVLLTVVSLRVGRVTASFLKGMFWLLRKDRRCSKAFTCDPKGV